MIRKNIFITGPPGIGKTTIIGRVLLEIPPYVSREGFLTGEIRESGVRVGFEIRYLDGRKGMLAHKDIRSRYRVGKYGVDIRGFEALVLPLLDVQGTRLVVIDEIGKMECFSRKFCLKMKDILDVGPPVFGSVALKGTGFIGEVKSRRDMEIFEVTLSNRDALVPILVREILERV